MENVRNIAYLGHIISNENNNETHILEIQKKSIRITNKIFNLLNSIYLGKYYFECAMILINCMLRNSILYSIETCYNLTENEVRKIEKCEEIYLRHLLKQSRKVQISQLYLETVWKLCRFEIMKRKLMYLHYILQKHKESFLFKVL